MKTKLLLISPIAPLLLAGVTHASITITSTGLQELITFDADYAGVYRNGTSNTNSTKLSEPTNPAILAADSDAPRSIITTGASLKYGFANSGNAYNLGADSNGNSNTTDGRNFNILGVVRPNEAAGSWWNTDYGDSSQITSNRWLLSGDDDFTTGGLYFRIQNNTGATVTDWKFDADVFFKEDDLNSSSFTWGYSITNSLAVSSMSFTSLGATPAITNGDTLATLKDPLSQTVSTTGVANGEYIVLAFEEIGGGTGDSAGSTVMLDNIGVTAIPEPSSISLLGLGALGLIARRRR